MHSLSEQSLAVMVWAKRDDFEVGCLAAHLAIEDMVDFGRRLTPL